MPGQHSNKSKITLVDESQLQNCVAFLLVKEGSFLVERRSGTAKLNPGIYAIPGGHMEHGETRQETLVREANEELGIAIRSAEYICSLLHPAGVLHRIHYYAIHSWAGEVACRTAEALKWVSLTAVESLDLSVDRTALAEYMRVYKGVLSR